MKLSAPASLLRAKNVTGWSRNTEARPGSRRAELPAAQIRHRICESSSVAGNSMISVVWKENVMMNALIAATLCSIVLASAPVAMRAYVYARRKDDRRRHYR